MILFLRKIPTDTTRTDIVEFLDPVLKGGFLQSKGHIENIELIILKDEDSKTVEHHALVTIDSESAGKRAIKKLNRKALNGKHIMIHEYVFRSWQNDPRENDGEWNEELQNKRKHSRRRDHLTRIQE